ncbi:MAG TPA: ABC transporter permease [Bryobacteraceae bacterium]|nr:ABC transporter permease [Bryobacteraceae bacterium]
MPSVELHFDDRAERVWQVIDPATESLLDEGICDDPDVRVTLPEGDGAYRVQVAPANHREKLTFVEAQVTGGLIVAQQPRKTSAAAMRWKRFFRAVPKAFVYPVRSVAENHKLMGSMVRRDILARYRGSFGGSLWTILNPLLLMTTYYFVFGRVLKTQFEGGSYILYFLAGMLPWLAFSDAVGRSPTIMLEYRSFVKKLVFPLEILPMNLVIAGAVTEAIGLAIFASGLLIARHSLPVSILWLPVLIVPQLLFTAGLCWFLAALGVFFRDFGQIIGFILTAWFFLTPICYEESKLRGMTILTYNPLYVLVRSYRAILLEHHAPSAIPLLWLSGVSLVMALAGYAWFHRLRRSFADVI